MLTPRKRITKKQLKEDKLVTLYAKSRDWVEANFKLVSGAAAVILLLIVGCVTIRSLNWGFNALVARRIINTCVGILYSMARAE